MKSEGNFGKGSFDICGTPVPDNLSFTPENPAKGAKKEDVYFHPYFGWINPSVFMFSTKDIELQKQLSDFVESEGGKGCTRELVVKTKDPKMSQQAFGLGNAIVARFQDRLSKLAIEVNDVVEIHICNHAPWCMFIRVEGTPFIGVDGETVRNQHESSPSTETIEPLDLLSKNQLNEIRAEIPQPTTNFLTHLVTVGIVEPASGPHYEYTEALVKHEYKDQSDSSSVVIKAHHIPVSEFRAEELTVFDLFCALADPKIREVVDVINISMGYYSQYENKCLKKLLEGFDQPIVCSAGNEGADNDQNGHWPSNFSRNVLNVIAVAAATDHRNLFPKSNYGQLTVTMAGPGTFDAQNRVAGTSIAAAWVSRCLAAAFSIKEDRLSNLDDVVGALTERNVNREELYSVSISDSGTLPILKQVIFTTGQVPLAT